MVWEWECITALTAGGCRWQRSFHASPGLYKEGRSLEERPGDLGISLCVCVLWGRKERTCWEQASFILSTVAMNLRPQLKSTKVWLYFFHNCFFLRSILLRFPSSLYQTYKGVGVVIWSSVIIYPHCYKFRCSFVTSHSQLYTLFKFNTSSHFHISSA